VRDIVGVLESLLDRLLIERKDTTLRDIVGKLVTTDLTATVASGSEKLMKEEVGHLHAELVRLREDIRASEASWEERFVVTRELRDSQDDLFNFMDKRYKDVEARLDVGEAGFVPRKELDERLAKVTKDLGEANQRIVGVEEGLDQQRQVVNAQKEHCNSTFETKARVSDLEKKLSEELASLRDEARNSAAELRNYAASAQRLAEYEAENNKVNNALTTSLKECTDEISRVSAALTKTIQDNQDTFQTKADHDTIMSQFKEERLGVEGSLRESHNNLKETSATKASLEQSISEAQAAVGKLQDTAAANSSNLRETTEGLKALEEHCHSKLATKEYAYDEAQKAAHQVVTTSDGKQELEQLMRDFEEERERLRQTVRQPALGAFGRSGHAGGRALPREARGRGEAPADAGGLGGLSQAAARGVNFAC
jgi:myosin heavy subunit